MQRRFHRIAASVLVLPLLACGGSTAVDAPAARCDQPAPAPAPAVPTCEGIVIASHDLGPDPEASPFVADLRSAFDASFISSSPSEFTLHVPSALFVRVQKGER